MKVRIYRENTWGKMRLLRGVLFMIMQWVVLMYSANPAYIPCNWLFACTQSLAVKMVNMGQCQIRQVSPHYHTLAFKFLDTPTLDSLPTSPQKPLTDTQSGLHCCPQEGYSCASVLLWRWTRSKKLPSFTRWFFGVQGHVRRGEIHWRCTL